MIDRTVTTRRAGVTKVLFVCLGNICRSPTAHGVFATKLLQQGLQGLVEVDSCGTGDWHVGRAPDRRAIAEAAKRGYDLGQLRARQLRRTDFDTYDYVLAMDRMNLATLTTMCPVDYGGRLDLFLRYAQRANEDEVPDPYYGGAEGFTRVLDLVEQASDGLLAEIRDAHSAA